MMTNPAWALKQGDKETNSGCQASTPVNAQQLKIKNQAARWQTVRSDNGTLIAAQTDYEQFLWTWTCRCTDQFSFYHRD